MKNKYSIVHWGPIHYTNSLVSAHAFRSKCLGRGWFIDKDTNKRVVITEPLKIYNLQTNQCIQP